MGFESQEGWNMRKHPHLHGNEIWGESQGIDSFSSDLGCYVENTAEDGLLWSKYQQEHQRQLFSNLGLLDDLYVDIVSPPFQSYHCEILPELASAHSENSLLDEDKMENPCEIPLSSLGILKNYGSGFRRLNGERIKVPSYGTTCSKPIPKVNGQKLSTENILCLAGKRFVQSSSQRIDGISALSHPFDTSFLGLSYDETKDVELVQNLLASAEKVGQQQYNCASKKLSQCDESPSDTGNPVQRVVYYFSEALRGKVDRETGKSTSKGMGKQQLLDIERAVVSPDLAAIVAFRQKVPFCQVCEFSGIQAIIEHVSGAKKVHLIDLEIRNGMQCTVLMQALAGQSECPLELLKITAVATKSKSKLEETGERLMGFANSMNIPYSFRIVMVSDMLDLKEDLFDLEAEETVAIGWKL
ncbi:DELLA protein RGL2-like [Actinidia eriantha]|uniref:DELLA protein RGL2-like n=1 Tax=Actinidia eriantha TaxID=165200 RepID=UPI0025868992|nr:DELLA protein RGL2-like [Actinidia eriantha]